MKKFLVKLFTLLVATVMVLSMSACGEKIVKLKFTLSVYDIEEQTMVEETLTYNMHQSLAETAVKEVKKLVEDGYFDNCVFYKQSKSNGVAVSTQLFFGGLNRVGTEITQNAPVAIPDAEFEKNGVTGSNLINDVGYIGLWRTWDTTKSYSTSGYGKTISTMYMPTASLSSYNGNFCVFAKYASSDDLAIIENIIDLLATTDYVTEYTCYYSANDDGELIDANGEVLEFDESTGMLVSGAPVWNIVSSASFEEDKPENIYNNEDYTQYNEYTISVLNADKLVIKDIIVK